MVSWQQVLYVGAGGFLGAVARFLAGLGFQRIPGLATFPFATLAVNVSGSLLIGLLAGLAETRGAPGPDLRLFLLTGVLGGFTTYSSFALETWGLAAHHPGKALLYVALQLLLGLGAAALGLAWGRA